MNRKIPVLLFFALFFSSCEEEPIDVRNTAPQIGFAFFIDSSPRMPDSVFTSEGKRIFIDSASFYRLPLSIDTFSIYEFHIDTIVSSILVEYEIQRQRDVDRVNYQAYNPFVAGTNLDSLIITCTDTITCKTNEAIINLYF